MKTNSFTPPATGGYCIPWLPVALLHRRTTAASVALPEPQDGGRDALSPGVPLYLGTLSRPRKTRKDHIHRLKLDGDRVRDNAAVCPRTRNRRDHTDAIGNLVDHPYLVVGARIHGDGPQSDWNLGEQTGTGWRRYVENGEGGVRGVHGKQKRAIRRKAHRVGLRLLEIGKDRRRRLRPRSHTGR